MKKQAQSGNILFLILIAIALLGALTVLMSRSGSQSDDTGSAEQSSIQASQILKHAASLQNATQMLIGRGCSENVLSFEAVDSDQATGYNNAAAPTDKSCHIFEPEGAALKYKESSEFFPGRDWSSAFNDIVGRSALPDLGTSAAELYWVFELPPNSGDICRMLNSRLGFTDPTPPVSSIFDTPAYAGTFSPPVAVVTAALSGKKSFCVSRDAGGTQHLFVSVLIVR